MNLIHKITIGALAKDQRADLITEVLRTKERRASVTLKTMQLQLRKRMPFFFPRWLAPFGEREQRVVLPLGDHSRPGDFWIDEMDAHPKKKAARSKPQRSSAVLEVRQT